MARALRAARDPAWTADGYVSERWLPVSPVSGRLDAFQWKVPLAELSDGREVIDDIIEDDDAPAITTAAGATPSAALPEPASSAPATTEAPAPQSSATQPAQRPAASPRVEPVIPLVHVPDDPGPEPGPEFEPEPEPPGGRLYK
jgi:HemY protein